MTMITSMNGNPVGRLVHARDGGLAAPMKPPDDPVARAQANPDDPDGDRSPTVRGTAIRYGVVGHFPYWGALRVEPGALTAPGNHWRYRTAILSLYDHQSAHILGRTDKGTMNVHFGDQDITYSVRLNPDDPMAAGVWARVQRGDVDAASVGFIPLDGEWTEAVDNGLDADADDDGRLMDVFAVTSGILLEVSLVAQGAFAGASSMPAHHPPAAGQASVAEQAVYVSHRWPVFDTVAGSVVASNTNETEPATAGTVAADRSGASTDEPAGDPGNDPGCSRETAGGAAQPDDTGNTDGNPVAAAETGVTLEQVLAAMPDELARRARNA